jgi:hypothetical protein
MKRGRPKGYTPYIDISYEELADWVGRKTKVPVSKKWLQSLMGEDFADDTKNIVDTTDVDDYCEENVPQIEYKLTQL